jgi:RimJ/RimL family protein N-acetyltransferase
MMVLPNRELAVAIGQRLRSSDARAMLCASFHDDPVEYVCERARAGGAKWVLVEDGEALGMGGFEPIAPGTVNAWLIGTPEWPRRRFEVVRWARRAVRHILASGAANRVQAYCFAHDPGANRFLEAVGLVHEATFRKYAEGHDVNVWSAIHEDDPVVH